MRDIYFLFQIVFLPLFLLSCGKQSWETPRRIPQYSTETGGAEQQPRNLVFNLVLAEYPEGYDWIRDTQYGTVDCDIVLMRQDGMRLHGFKAGYYHDVSTDPDMVRCIDGHVFTDYSTEDMTVIKRDGEEIFRYEGREMMAGFVESGGSVYTLGIPREGSGWVYRQNGNVLSSSSAGTVMLGLYLDEGVPVFGYRITEIVDYRTETRYYVVRDGVQTRIMPGLQETVAGFRLLDGKLCLVTLDSVTGEAFWSVNRQGRIGMETAGAKVSGMEQMVADTVAVYSVGYLETGDGAARTAIWKGPVLYDVLDESFNLVACFPDGDDFNAVGYYGDDSGSQFLYRNGGYSPLPDGYRLDSGTSAVFAGGHYCLCLNPVSAASPPLYIIDGQEYRTEVNGCFLAAGAVWETYQDNTLD